MQFDSHTLPPLSADEQHHSNQLHERIREEIESVSNWIPFDRFMELALYAPGLGYYSAGAHKLGTGGDFTTAPEISPLFSHCVANQCAQVLQSVKGGSILELGAGSGTMAAEALSHLESLQTLPDRYYILEVSADLQQRQVVLLANTVPHLLERVEWLSALPTDFCGVVIANEVIDALPVKRFTMLNGMLHELGVSAKDDLFFWLPQPVDTNFSRAINHITTEIGTAFADGYTSEINTLLHSWLKSLSDCVSRGALLFMDYGFSRKQYYCADRTRGTLNCFFKHHQHDDPLVNIGVQDITAWVDFTALAEAGLDAGLELCGYSTQAHFLIGAGIESVLRNAMSRNDLTDTQRWQLSQQVQQLMLPSGMGETFKAMAFKKNCDMELSGFAFRDLRESL